MKNNSFFNDNVAVRLNLDGANAPAVLSKNNADSLAAQSKSDARALISYEQALALEVLPLGLEKINGTQQLIVAAKKETAQHVKQVLQFCSGLVVVTVVVEEKCLSSAIFKAYKNDSERLLAVAYNLHSLPVVLSQSENNLVRYDKGLGDIAHFVAGLIDYCIAEKASDIHITPLKSGTRIRIRRSGELLEHENIIGSNATHTQIINRLKVLASIPGINTNEPCDGTFKAGLEGSPTQIRLSCVPSLHGENAVLRLHNSAESLELKELGYDSDLIQLLLSYSHKPNGLFLFAGPTGSGKTTALYAFLKELKTRSLSIHSIEDPVEQTIDGLVQTAVNNEAGLSYSTCLKAVLRQDPDVVVVGELRDKESAHLIVQASLTGHLVVSTVHARSVMEVIQRFQHFEVSPFDLVGALQVVICQELLPRLCSDCRITDLTGSSKITGEVCKAPGCTNCDYSSYIGQVPANEYLFTARRPNHIEIEQVLKSSDLSKIGTFQPWKSSILKLLQSASIDWKTAREYL